MWPDLDTGHIILNAESEGTDDGGPSSNPGLYIGSFHVSGWRNYSGGGTTVLGATKGCAVIFCCDVTPDGVNAYHTLKPPTGLGPGNTETDNDTLSIAMNVVQFSDVFHHFSGQLYQFSAVNAGFANATLFCARLAAYEYDTDPYFGKWFFP